MLSNLNTNLKTMSRKQDELATGKRVIFASDDPVAASKIMKFKSDLADMDQYSSNVRDAQSWLDASESSIAEAGSVIQRVRELAVQAANGSNTAQDTQKIKEEVSQLKEHLISITNSNLAGRYLFASHYTDKPVLDKNGNYNMPITLKDTIDPEVAVYEVGAAQKIKVGTHAYSFLKGDVDATAYATAMPAVISTNGAVATKPNVTATFNLAVNYSVGNNIDVIIGGNTYRVDKSKLVGTALTPISSGEVVKQFNLAGRVAPTADPTDQLSAYADIFFDQTGVLNIKGKNTGLASTVQVGAPLAAGMVVTSSNPALGTNAVPASVIGAVNVSNADAATFAGKSFMMTLNGITKQFDIPATPIAGSVAALTAQLQGMIDNATTGFGPGKVTVGGAAGSPLSFTSIPVAGETKNPRIEIAPIVVKTPKLIKDLDNMITYLNTGNHSGISSLLGEMDVNINNILAVRADIGARGSRLELITNRISENSINFTRMLSDSQDADMSSVIMVLKNAENVYKSALSVGGRVIQPTLLDFLR